MILHYVRICVGLVYNFIARFFRLLHSCASTRKYETCTCVAIMSISTVDSKGTLATGPVSHTYKIVQASLSLFQYQCVHVCFWNSQSFQHAFPRLPSFASFVSFRFWVSHVDSASMKPGNFLTLENEYKFKWRMYSAFRSTCPKFPKFSSYHFLSIFDKC